MTGSYENYARHLYWKYESQLSSWDKDMLWNGCHPDDFSFTDEEER